MIGQTGERVYDGEVGRFVETTAIPCHRCGICCERWQPLVAEPDVARLSAFLHLRPEDFLRQYTTAYPFDDEVRLLRREGSGCVFLRRDDDGRSACAVHPERPEICRDWTASLDRRECVDGFARFGSPGTLIPLHVVYPDADERLAYGTVVRGEGGDDDA